MFALTLIEIAFAVCGFVLFYNFYYKRRNLPPGPAPWPLIGNVLEIAKKGSAENAFLDWKRRYGPIYTYWAGETPLVAVADYKLIIETFHKDGDAYAGRPPGMGQKLHVMTRGEPRGGVIFTQGELWREHRRFTLQVLRNLGLSKDLMQERVLNEVSALLSKVHDNLNESKSQEQDLPALLDIAVGSVINMLLFGYRFDESRAQEFYELKRLLSGNIEAMGGWKMKMLNAYPHLLHKVPPFDAVYEEHKRSQIRLWDFYQRQIDEHVQNIDFDTDAEPTDYAEAFLREKRKKDTEGEPHTFTLSQLKSMCQDLFVAGQETTSTTSAWGTAFLVNNPKAQARLHEELDNVIGSDRLVTMTDRPQMHYTNAVINEVQRLCNMVPQNIPHATTRDVTIEGYLIPKGTVILPQISTVLYDEEIFPEHTAFKPERFLDANGHLKRTDELIPFSVGKRQCLGESLARMELFLFLANILNQFKLSAGEKMPSLKRHVGATAQCPPYSCLVEKRNL